MTGSRPSCVTLGWPMLRRMTDQIVCPECGSSSLVACGVYEHGTWQYRLSCWTCRDCRAVVGVAEAAIDTLRA
jgi:transcription elongation factor Elf1